MTTVKLTQRIKDVIIRQLTCDFGLLMNDVNTQIRINSADDGSEDKYFLSRVDYNEDIAINITTFVTPHDDDCVGYPYSLDTGCDCPDVRYTQFQVSLKYKGIHTLGFPLNDPSLKKMVKQIKKDFPSSMTICQCGEMGIEATLKCRRCYIQSYTRTEEEGGNCSICLENDGVWIKTKCGHIFHQHCLVKAKAVNPVCPMCRGDIDYGINCWHSHGMNPYNV